MLISHCVIKGQGHHIEAAEGHLHLQSDGVHLATHAAG